MLKLIKNSCFAVLMLACAVQTASAFSLLGPFAGQTPDPIDGFKEPVIGYQLGGDIGTPQNIGDARIGIGEGYRWNIPVLTYGFDRSFLEYFGMEGVAAIEDTIAIFNNLPPMSALTLDDFPLNSFRQNHRARALGLVDLKTYATHLMIEQLGLAEPVRWTWALRGRWLPAGSCPDDMEYFVIKRNFDPVTFRPTSYVNGSLLSYRIFEFCTGPNPLADAVEFTVDPLIPAVAVAESVFGHGRFITGLTRDDVGGLRFLYATNRVTWEDQPANAQLIGGGFTNALQRQLLVTQDLAQLTEDARTLPQDELLEEYPDLIIEEERPFWTNVVTTNITAFFTNAPPTAPIGSPPVLIIETNFVTNVVQLFDRTFANVVTNVFQTWAPITIQETNVFFPIGGPIGGPLQTNVTSITVISNFVNGDFYIVPPDFCDFHIVHRQHTNRVFITNVVSTLPIPPDPDPDPDPDPGDPDPEGQLFVQNVIRHFDQHFFVVDPIICVEGPALRQGVDKITFVRTSHDSLTGEFFEPVTNHFQLTWITNNMPVVQTYRRISTQPDILFAAADLVAPPIPFIASRTISWNTNNLASSSSGPGLIEPPVVFEFNKVGPLYENWAPFFLDEATQFHVFTWGRFDGSTNAPIVFPNGTDISDLEDVLLIRITNESPLAGARRGQFYSVQFGGTGGERPYMWSLAPDSEPLPSGLTLSAGGVLSGTPVVAGNFTFRVRLTDAGMRRVEKEFSLAVGL